MKMQPKPWRFEDKTGSNLVGKMPEKEKNNNKKSAKCCGYGGLVDNAHIQLVISAYNSHNVHNGKSYVSYFSHNLLFLQFPLVDK